MLYISTRGKAEMVSASHAIACGLAADGGLFVPKELPHLSTTELLAMANANYSQRAVTILSRFLTDFTEAELNECVKNAYSKESFSEAIAPLHKVKNNIDVLELWHGPTSAFKDMALQILPQFLTRAVVKTGEEQKLVILVATSGDTGKAALDGFADVEGTEVVVFYPDQGVSQMQRLQMVTQTGKNVHVVAVKGNFDDAQTGVKDLFGDKNLVAKLAEQGVAFSSANSINWGRLVPQIVYYFSSYVDAVKASRIKPGDKINFSVPTGNFGDILAGYFAKLMGLPVNKFICASNTNNVLSDFINTGIYNKNRPFHKTISPSMDILVSSNLERLLFEETEHDGEQVGKWMTELKEKGQYNVGKDVQTRILADFFGTWVDEIETKETIGYVFNNYGYVLDPHSAVAYRALEKYRLLTSDDRYSIVLSTASPFKFSNVVLGAIAPESKVEEDKPFEAMHLLSAKSKLEPPALLVALEKLPVLHREVIEKDGLKAEVEKILGF